MFCDADTDTYVCNGAGTMSSPKKIWLVREAILCSLCRDRKLIRLSASNDSCFPTHF
jgi:hypothetical protein